MDIKTILFLKFATLRSIDALNPFHIEWNILTCCTYLRKGNLQ